MNDQVEHLLLAHRRAICSDMSRLVDEMRTMRSEITALRQHVGGVVTLQEHDHTDIGAIKARLDRIERRLDLVA